MGETGSTTFAQQYWYVILTLCLGLTAIIVFNLIAFLYFSRRKSLNTEYVYHELDRQEPAIIHEEEEEVIQTETSFVADRQPSVIRSISVLENENTDLGQFRMDAVTTHNEYRSQHNAPPLQISDELSAYAQYWAENMAIKGSLFHSPMDWRLKFNNEPLGENLVMTQGFKLTGKSITDMWYGESYKHNYRELQKDTKSFTQMVWANSKLVGFGRAKNKNGRWYGCALYYPEGNLAGQFHANVFPFKRS